MIEQKRYQTRPGRVLVVRGRRVTDDPAGTPLPVAVAREHVACGRLIEVMPADDKGAGKRRKNTED